MSGKILIGVTGEPGVGKTTLVRELEKCKIHPIYTDEIAHQVLNLRIVKSKLSGYFGKQILNNDKICAKKLGKRAFRDKKSWRALVLYTHPYIKKRVLKIVRETDFKHYAVDAALLFESGFDDYCDFIVLVKASEKLRNERLKNRLSPNEAKRRISFLIPLKIKESMSDFIFINNQNKRKVEENAKKIRNRIKNS